MAHWRELNDYPQSYDRFSIYDNGKIKNYSSKEEVKNKLKNYTLYSKQLISNEKYNIFLPPLIHGEFSDFIFKGIKLKAIFVLKLLLSLLFLHVTITFFMTLTMHRVTLALLVIVVHFFVEYKFMHSDLIALQERSMFLYWIRKKINLLQLFFITCFICIGLAQLLFYLNSRSIANVVENYGLYYKEIDRGEYWRFITGPFIHSNFQHWVINFFLFYVGCIIHPRLASLKTLILTLTSAIVSGIAVYFINYRWQLNTKFDAFCGLSAGIFFVFALQTTVSFRFKDEFPKNFYITLLMYTLLNFLLPYFNEAKTSNVAHLVGLLLGALYGFSFTLREIAEDTLPKKTTPT
jgi:membrane associated rhomboid family serine protease